MGSCIDIVWHAGGAHMEDGGICVHVCCVHGGGEAANLHDIIRTRIAPLHSIEANRSEDVDVDGDDEARLAC